MDVHTAKKVPITLPQVGHRTHFALTPNPYHSKAIAQLHIMSGRWPEDIEPEIPDLSPYLSNDNYMLDLWNYPGGEEAFKRYFELDTSGGGWSVKPKPRVQVIKITYGGAHITDRTVLQRFHDAIRDYQPILISNETLGGDPLPMVLKEFVIDYKNVNNEDNRCLKSRKMREGETLDFGWDIKYVLWGADSDVWSLDKFPTAYSNLFWALDHEGDVAISCETMGCDPAPGRVKYCRVVYSHPQRSRETQSVGEGGRLRFTQRWPGPKKEECVIM
ncbi:hypothetical protein HWV62_30775 [Athelia sp. TMB]|nr:hypothetical protein HWV62_15136 [Athelia sp. TMB]KAF7981967.1 hypothetical protein HWV62_30775 [Athelia sp. TMB]